MSKELKGLELLRAPFPENQINLLPKPYKKESPKGNCNECGGYHGLPAAHLKYVGHAALTHRLLDADPNWTWEPMALRDGLPAFDENGGLWIRLTVCGITRIGYGNASSSSFKEIGTREKEVIGDALRNAAMRFGAALDLWHKGDLHGIESEDQETKERDKGSQETALPKRDTPVQSSQKPPATAQQAIESLRKTVSEKPKEDYSGYVISFGKYKGKSLSTLSEAAILQYRDFLIKSAEKDNKPMSNNALDFVNHAESYLMTLGYSFDKPPQDSELISEKDLEEIPF